MLLEGGIPLHEALGLCASAEAGEQAVSLQRIQARIAALLPFERRVLELAATVGAAIDHHRGRGVMWKSRAYTGSGT